MLEQGIIRPSTSPWASPIWIVPKKEDASGHRKWRLVIDYRKLNLKTIDDRYPIPNITEILDKLGRCQYFTTLDLASGFHQIEVHPEDVQKTAFSVEHGLYEFLRMPFGLKNAPATFQRVMDHVLKDLIGVCCLVYMDDIIIFSSSLQEHLINLSRVLKALEKVNLKVQLDKSEFLKKEVAFLGHIVTDEGVKPNPNKIETIKKWPIPTNQKELKGFLGLLGYYRKFIRDFAKITKPLTAQLRNGEKVEHTAPFLKTFEICKNLLTSSDVLKYPDFSLPFILTTDASNFALGAVLSQGTVGKDRPVAYASRTLTKSEENYSAIEKELLAIDWATKYFRPYLFGRKFTLYTDHQPLTYALNLKTPNSKLVKWRLRLSEFNFDVEYKPGKQNVVADALSRIPSENVELNINEEMSGSPADDSSDDSSVHSADSDNTDLIQCTEQPINFFSNQIILRIGDRDNETFQEIFPRVYRRVITKINFGVPVIIRIMKEYMSPKRANCIMCPENVIQSLQVVYRNYFSRNKLFKLKISQKLLIDITSEEEQDLLVEQTHETSHRGIKENRDEIIRRYYFPNMKRKVKRFVSMCESCNRMKYERKPYKIKLGETPIPLDIVHIDIFINQPNIFISFIDRFSRFGSLISIKSRSIPDVRRGLIKYFSIYGYPKLLVSDNEPSLKSIEIRGLLNDLNIQQYFIPSNHSESNGMVERFHSTVSEIYRCNKHKFQNLSQKEMFLIACTMYNNAIHTSTNLKPREIFYGIKDGTERPLDMDKMMEARNRLYDEAILKITESQRKQHNWHNKEREDPPILEVDQHIYNKKQGFKSKTREQFENVRVAVDHNQSYEDDSQRKLHKGRMRRVR
jgi:transposase InsO family protein